MSFDLWTMWATLLIVAVVVYLLGWFVASNLLMIWAAGWAIVGLSAVAIIYLAFFNHYGLPISWLVLGLGLWSLGTAVLTWFQIAILFAD
jgi:hypothetical protein